MIQLRGYQLDLIQQVRASLRHVRRVLIQAPTGSGKTAMVAAMIKGAADKGNRTWFVCHRRELLKQAEEAFLLERIPYGLIASNKTVDSRAITQICSVGTLANRYKYLPAPKMIVWDEAQHLAAGTWARIHAHFPDAVHLGLTATPERHDGTGLEPWFDDMVMGPSVPWLIERGYLADYRILAPGGGINMTGVAVGKNDYVQKEMRQRVDRPSITGDAVKHYLKYAPGQRAIVFCASIAHSQHVVEEFLRAGVVAEHVDGKCKTSFREAAVRRFREGTTTVLSNVDLFGEGFDLPAASCALLLRPTKSLALYLQQCGRVLRPAPGKKEAIILDHAGSCVHHGLPCDEFDWQLKGRTRKKGGQDRAPPVRICTTCFAALPGFKRVCEFCGADQPLTEREIKKLDGELEEIDKLKVRRDRKREQSEAKTYEALVQLGKDRKYKHPEYWAECIWGRRVVKAKQRRTG